MLLSPKPGAILCQTVDRHFTVICQTLADISKHSDYTVTIHTSFIPRYLNFLLCAPLVPESVSVWRAVQLSPTMHKGLCNFVSVLPSFTYLTAAVLSFFVFPFTLYSTALSSALTLAEQWITLIVGLSDPSDQHACVDFDQFDCDEAVSIMAGGITLDRDKQMTPRFLESAQFQWKICVKDFPNWSEPRL